jgi:hypothetical protein
MIPNELGFLLTNPQAAHPNTGRDSYAGLKCEWRQGELPIEFAIVNG